MSEKKKVLITGASGLVGGVLREGLKKAYHLSGVDRTDIPDFELLVADSTDLEAIKPAFEGKDVVIDLASNPSDTIPWEEAYENNLRCTYNALQAARDANVKRLIFASSIHVTRMYEFDKPYSDIVAGSYGNMSPSDIPLIKVSDPIRPGGPYGIVKAFGEAAGRHFSDRYGLSVICLRLGSFNIKGQPKDMRQFATLLTHVDLVQLVDKCIMADDSIKFAIFWGVSNNRWRIWDISNAKELIGYEPNETAETFRYLYQ